MHAWALFAEKWMEQRYNGPEKKLLVNRDINIVMLLLTVTHIQ